jgi:hypothetical protein
MKYIIALCLFCGAIFGQDLPKRLTEGSVSYISSQFIYIGFESTTGLTAGDTLFVRNNNSYSPIAVITYLSQKSVAATAFPGKLAALKIGSSIYGYASQRTKQETVVIPDTHEKQSPVPIQPPGIPPASKNGFTLSGRVSVSSASDYAASSSFNSQQWRSTITLHGDNFLVPGLSFSDYQIISVRGNEWGEFSANPFNKMRFYDLAISADLAAFSKMWIGRHLSTHMANVGAIDGIQFERATSSLSYGAFVGSRPSFNDYGFDAKLFQFGGYISEHTEFGEARQMENTCALFNQTNNMKIDRRFVYLQHSDNLLQKVTLFASSEIDLFSVESGMRKNTPSLTSLYSSLRVDPFSELSISLSYDARKNVVYYETFHSFLDSLFSNEMRQGFRWNIYARCFPKIAVSLFGGIQTQANDPKPTQNYGGNIYFSEVPFLAAQASINGTYLNGSYVNGYTINADISKNIFTELYLSIGARTFQYKYLSTDQKYSQQGIYSSCSIVLAPRLSLSFNYEGTFEQSGNGSRIYVDISQRF